MILLFTVELAANIQTFKLAIRMKQKFGIATVPTNTSTALWLCIFSSDAEESLRVKFEPSSDASYKNPISCYVLEFVCSRLQFILFFFPFTSVLRYLLLPHCKRQARDQYYSHPQKSKKKRRKRPVPSTQHDARKKKVSPNKFYHPHDSFLIPWMRS